MKQIGRNDPCPCGSGKKYKKCCMEKDQAANVIRIGRTNEQAEDPSAQQSATEESVHAIVNQLPWGNPLYEMLARHLINRMAGRYDWEYIEQAVILWHAYSSSEQPVTRKANVFPAAIEYCMGVIYGDMEVTQAKLAELYDVSPATISQRANRIMDFAEAELPDMFGDEGSEDPFDTDYGDLPRAEDIISMEKAMLNLSRGIGKNGKTSKKTASAKDQAEELLYAAWSEPDQGKRTELARKALKLYPDSADAYNILAETTSKSLQAIAKSYSSGMAAGERDLGGDFFRKNKGYFWGLIETRPFMRAKFGYAEACLLMGKSKEAARHLEELLELNPNDNQGARHLLCAALLEQKDFDAASRLIERYNEDTANANYDKILVEYGLNGISPKLAGLLKQARKQNPHVSDYLLGKKPVPDEFPEFIGYGDESEATDYMMTRDHLWERNPKLLHWMAKQR